MANASIAVQRIPELSHAPFRSKFNRSFPFQRTLYPDGVFPLIKNLRMFPGDTIDLSIDAKFTMLYRTSPMIDALEVNVYCFYADYRQLSNTYTRTRGENLSVSSDTNVYRLPKITSVYPVVAWNVKGNINQWYAHTLRWKQNGQDIIPQLFDTTTGRNVNASVKYVRGIVQGQYLRGDDDEDNQTGDSNKEYTVGFAIGSLPDYLGAVCGVAPLAIDATPYIMYYLTCDRYFRNQEMFDSIVGIVPDVDKDRVWNIWSEWQGMSPYYHYAYGSVKKFYPPHTTTQPIDVLNEDATDMEMLSGIGPGGIYRASRKPDYQALALANPTYHGIEVMIPGLPSDLELMPDGAITFNSMDGTVIPSSSPILQQALNISNIGDQNVAQGSLQFTSGGNMQQQRHYLEYASGLKIGTNTIGAGTMQELRTAFQLLQFYQAKNIAGKYIQDIISMMFGINDPSPDDRFPQLLKVLTGAFDFIANQQTSEASATSPQGNITTSGVCRIVGKLCHKSTIYDAHVQVLVVIRQPSIVFEDRMEPWWFIQTELEYPWPQFARLSDQPVFNYEVYCPAVTGYVVRAPISDATTAFAVPQDGTGENTTAHYQIGSAGQNLLNDLWKPYGYQERYADMKYAYPDIAGGFRMRAEFMQQYRWPSTMGYRYKPTFTDYVADNKTGDEFSKFYMKMNSETQWNLNVSYDNRDLVPAGRKFGFMGRPQREENGIKYTSGDIQYRHYGTQNKSITPWDKNMFDSIHATPIQVVGQAYCYYESVLPVHTLPGLADHF